MGRDKDAGEATHWTQESSLERMTDAFMKELGRQGWSRERRENLRKDIEHNQAERQRKTLEQAMARSKEDVERAAAQRKWDRQHSDFRSWAFKANDPNFRHLPK